MGYIPNVQFAPWYVAQEKGYFEDAGLEITMDYGKVNDVMRLLAAGEIDFVIAGGDEVIVARSQDLPVTYVMALYARFPAAVVSLKEAAINEPRSERKNNRPSGILWNELHCYQSYSGSVRNDRVRCKSFAGRI